MISIFSSSQIITSQSETVLCCPDLDLVSHTAGSSLSGPPVGHWLIHSVDKLRKANNGN